jgi:hypothetical protein
MPTAIAFAGISFVTTALAPTMALSPMVMTFDNCDLGSKPHIAPDFYGRGYGSLLPNRNIELVETMIVIADGNHFSDQAIVANNQ